MKPSGDGGDKTTGRNFPSWMSCKESGEKQRTKKPGDVEVHEESGEGEKPHQATAQIEERSSGAHSERTKRWEKTLKRGEESSSSSTLSFSKLLDGVVFVLSGFVNPERSILRSRAIEMGAEYQPDWNSDCTLLVCAFTNTPKFRQVVADSGTIVSKEWMVDCYNQKKLLAIETYLMHVGKPWRRGSISHDATKGDVNGYDLNTCNLS